MPFWSPDSRDLGFFAGSALKRVSAEGGPVRLVTDNVGPVDRLRRLVGADGTIAFGRQAGCSACPRMAVPRRPCTKLPSQDWAHYWPSFLPDGRRFLFTAKLWTRAAEASEQGIYLGSLDSPTIDAAPAGPLECACYALARLSCLRAGGDALGGAVRPGRGTRHRPAGRNWRGRRD